MKIITGLFEPADAFKTLDQLIARGFTREELSLVSSTKDMPDYLEGDPENSAAKGAAIGAVAGGSVGALGAWIAPAIPGFEALFAAGMLTTAAGGVIGAFLGSIFNVRAESQTEIDVHDALANGKYLLVAKVEDGQVEEVAGLFEAGKGFDLEVNDIPNNNRE
jgi:hypothetical protein